MEKDLGVSVDSNLSFENHIAIKISKANKIVGLIRKLCYVSVQAEFTTINWF